MSASPLDQPSTARLGGGPVQIVVLIVLAAVVLAHVRLLPAAEWHGDEYVIVPGLLRGGWAELWRQLVSWSPRPVAEGLYYLYAEAVALARAPLIVPMLSLLWLAVGLAGAEWWRGAGPGVWPRRLVTLGWFAAFLVGHGISEVFYWPGAAMAYLPALAALTLLLTGLLRGWHPAGWRETVCLLVMAGSCEVGAMFAIAFAALSVPLGDGSGMARGRTWTWLRWAAPPLLGAAVLLLVALARVGDAGEVLSPEAATTHHFVASLIASAGPFASGLLGAPDGASPSMTGIASRVAFLVGMRLCLAAAALPPVRTRPLIAFVGAALTAAWGSTAAGFYQFGALCCQRHETMRQCLYALALTAVALVSLGFSSRRPVARVGAGWGGVLLALALLPSTLPRLTALWHDAVLTRPAAAARAETWRSGHQADSQTMVFRLPPELRLINPPFLAPGVYATSDPRWYVSGILGFFGKQSMTVLGSGSALPR